MSTLDMKSSMKIYLNVDAPEQALKEPYEWGRRGL